LNISWKLECYCEAYEIGQLNIQITQPAILKNAGENFDLFRLFLLTYVIWWREWLLDNKYDIALGVIGLKVNHNCLINSYMRYFYCGQKVCLLRQLFISILNTRIFLTDVYNWRAQGSFFLFFCGLHKFSAFFNHSTSQK